MLQKLGATVQGLALYQEQSLNLYSTLDRDMFGKEHSGGITDSDFLSEALVTSEAKIVIYMDAQTLVKVFYSDQSAIYNVNVIGNVKLVAKVEH